MLVTIDTSSHAHANVPCTTCPPQNLVWLVRITLALCHKVFHDIEAAKVSGNPEGSLPVLDGSPFGNQKRIYGHTHILWTCLVLGLLVRCTLGVDVNIDDNALRSITCGMCVRSFK